MRTTPQDAASGGCRLSTNVKLSVQQGISITSRKKERIFVAAVALYLECQTAVRAGECAQQDICPESKDPSHWLQLYTDWDLYSLIDQQRALWQS